MLTGQPSNPRGASDLDRVASRDDYPCYAAVLDHLRRRRDGIPSGVALPTPPGRGPAHLAGPGRRASSARGTTPGSSASTRTGPRPATTASPCPPGSTRRGCTAAATCSGQAAVPAPGDAFVDQQDAALAMLCNGQVGRAFDLDREDPRLVDRYGRHLFGQSLLLARRLVEAGVPIVQATMGIVQTWDTHVANFPRLKDDLLPPLDRAVSALLDDLEARGLLDETLVVMLGEFGRTPRIHRAEARATSPAATTGRRSSRPSSPAAGWSAAR